MKHWDATANKYVDPPPRPLFSFRLGEDERKRLTAAAAKFVPKPYWEGGSERTPGVDLSMYIRTVMLAVAVQLPELHEVDLCMLTVLRAGETIVRKTAADPRGARHTKSAETKSKDRKTKKAKAVKRKVARSDRKRKTRRAARRAGAAVRRAAAKAARAKK